MKKKRNLLFIIFLILFITLPVLLVSQEGRGHGRLKGVVVNTDGKPVEGAKVELVSLMHDFEMTTTTDEEGEWAFIGLGKSVVKIKVTKEGYAPTIIEELETSSFTKKMEDQRIVLKKLEELEGIEKEGPKTMFLRGQKLYEQGSYKKALDVFLTFIKENPNLYKARVNIGNCYVKLGEYDKAMQEFKTVLEKLKQEKEDLKGDETAASIYSSLGELYMDKNDYEKAKEHFEKSIEIDPKDPALAYNVAEILFNSNNIDEAIKYYKICAEIKPEWHKPYIKLGYCYVNKGEMDKAIDYLKKYIELAPEGDPQINAAKSLIEQLKNTK